LLTTATVNTLLTTATVNTLLTTATVNTLLTTATVNIQLHGQYYCKDPTNQADNSLWNILDFVYTIRNVMSEKINSSF